MRLDFVRFHTILENIALNKATHSINKAILGNFERCQISEAVCYLMILQLVTMMIFLPMTMATKFLHQKLQVNCMNNQLKR